MGLRYTIRSTEFLNFVWVVLCLSTSSHLEMMKLASGNGVTARAHCKEAERRELLAFKERLNDTRGLLSSWSGKDCCQWDGVTCHNKTGHVSKLELDSGLKLSLIDETRGHLPCLTKMQVLSLSYIDLGPDVSQAFAVLLNCSKGNLERLELFDAGLAGELPGTLGSLTNLKHLELLENDIWGSIPPSIGNLRSLQSLDLSYNQLNGTIPRSIHQLSELEEVGLHGNFWKGTITESHLMNFTKLKSLILSGASELVLKLRDKWSPPFSLDTLRLYNFRIGPKLPRWIQAQTALTEVTLSNVGIADAIPQEWLSEISRQATYIDLSKNSMAGSLPSYIHFPKLVGLDLSGNRFTGPIPANINRFMPSLAQLDLSNNSLQGAIPSSVLNMSTLFTLSLANNNLSGEIPSGWNQSERLVGLDLANNHLSGKFPSSLCSVLSRGRLLLNNNYLHGEITSSLENCSKLDMINLGENRLSGNLPSLIDTRGSPIQMLRLASNLFSGKIPDQWCDLPDLHILDVSDNNLSGPIPNCLGNLTFIAHGDIGLFEFEVPMDEVRAALVAKGRRFEYSGRILRIFNIIDLSRNKLTGVIPNEITRLTYLNTLNLSMNCLIGIIPRDIGKIKSLESLDLSSNSLSGSIPPSMSSLTFLGTLNLSFNHLEGRIPFGNQLQTLTNPSIYEGNPSLCGDVVSVSCPGNPTPNRTPMDDGASNDDNDGKSDEMLWFYSSMAFGIIVGFWGVCGSLVIKTSWRHAYFQSIDRLKDRILVVVELQVFRWKRKMGLN